jgi:hypothetical protein
MPPTKPATPPASIRPRQRKWRWLKLLWPKTWGEKAQVAQTAALVGLVIIFLAKLIFGYLVSNMSVVPTIQRTHNENGTDDLIVLTLKLTKGDREGINLKGVKIDVFNAETPIGKPLYTRSRDYFVREFTFGLWDEYWVASAISVPLAKPAAPMCVVAKTCGESAANTPAVVK